MSSWSDVLYSVRGRRREAEDLHFHKVTAPGDAGERGGSALPVTAQEIMVHLTKGSQTTRKTDTGLKFRKLYL
jgi:hypothetical protein